MYILDSRHLIVRFQSHLILFSGKWQLLKYKIILMETCNTSQLLNLCYNFGCKIIYIFLIKKVPLLCNFLYECISVRSLTLTLQQLFISVSYMPTSPIITDTNAISSVNNYVVDQGQNYEVHLYRAQTLFSNKYRMPHES